ncbi:hypothetical protein GCM10009817_34170 [Terrabacter lapilli]|uniref:DUF4203 domain-containing protein n=1 Tax=Terrabacter lapilli TaxID=436231 RepID=A0ABP5E067_9MICO
MVRSLVTGLCLAVFAAVIIGLSNLLGLDLEHVALVGAALGGVLGLVPHRPAWGKPVGFLAGFLLAWLGFALRAAWLPDSSGGRAVAAFLVVALIAVVAALSGGRLPLWSGLVGAASIVGSYESVYTSAPSQFLSDSPAAATTVLLAVGLGYLAASLVAPQGDPAAAGSRRPRRAAVGEEPTKRSTMPTNLDDLVTGAAQ